MNGIRNRISRLFLLLLLSAMVLSVVVSADTGPKPSVRITFEGLGEEVCYATLLSKSRSNGPLSAWEGEHDVPYHRGNFEYAELEEEIWLAFQSYAETDGYYFLQTAWQINETASLAWNYMPPQSFKILLYYPESGCYQISRICERYAFDSYFTADAADLSVTRSYDYRWELLSLAVRIGITLLIELAIAYLFGFRTQREMQLLLWVNAVTQIALNLSLHFINYYDGELSFVIAYVLLEGLVFLIEAVLYCLLLPRAVVKPRPKWVYVAYAWLANTVSFVGGMMISVLLPGIF